MDAVEGVWCHTRFIMGPEIERFESKTADYRGRKYAVGVNSGGTVGAPRRSVGGEQLTISKSGHNLSHHCNLSPHAEQLKDLFEDAIQRAFKIPFCAI